MLREEESRKAYDVRWREEKEAALPPHERAEVYRRRGNELYTLAREASKNADLQGGDISKVNESLEKFREAIAWYSKGIEISSNDVRLWSNRALCHSALEDWKRSREGARQCTRLRPDFMKGWFMLVKSLWKLGETNEARFELENSLRVLPQCPELLQLLAELEGKGPCSSAGLGSSSGSRPGSRSVSPACTPRAGATSTPTVPMSARSCPNISAAAPPGSAPSSTPGFGTPSAPSRGNYQHQKSRDSAFPPPPPSTFHDLGATSPPANFGNMSPPTQRDTNPPQSARSMPDFSATAPLPRTSLHGSAQPREATPTRKSPSLAQQASRSRQHNERVAASRSVSPAQTGADTSPSSMSPTKSVRRPPRDLDGSFHNHTEPVGAPTPSGFGAPTPSFGAGFGMQR